MQSQHESNRRFRPFSNSRWCDGCYDERVNAIREAYNIYVGDMSSGGEGGVGK